jgi:hypothetical protein
MHRPARKVISKVSKIKGDTGKGTEKRKDTFQNKERL